MRGVIRMLRYLLTPREQALTVALLVGLVVGAALELLSVSAIPAFVALLTSPRLLLKYLPAAALARVPAAVPDTTLVLWAAGGLLAITVVKNVALALLMRAQNQYTFDRQAGIAGRLLRAYLAAPYTFYLQRNTADLLHNVNQQSLDVIGGTVQPLFTLVLEGLTIVAIMTVLLVREPVISLFAFALLGGATAAFVRVIRSRMARYGEQMHVRRGRMMRVVNEGLGGIKITRVLGRERHFAEAFAAEAAAYAEAGRFRTVAAELPRFYLEVAAVLGLLGVAALLLAQRRPSQSVIPVLSLFAVALVRMAPSFNRVTGAAGTLRYGRHALGVIHDDLRALESAPRPADAPHGPFTFARELCFEGVSFRYPGAARVSLSEVSFAIPRGAAVGLVGPTGSGKTTMVDLILGLLDPSAGRILVDGRDVREDRRGWQRLVGYVPQDVYLTDASIRRNVALGLADDAIDDAAVARALEAAQLAELVRSLPDGVETMVGERGVRLSGGQRQRIGIARALYHDPEVLVMDEATSSLDGETERYVMQAVERLRGDRTIILVAHRMTTVRDCDLLVMLNAGEVSSAGTYDGLLADDQRFRRLVAAV